MPSEPTEMADPQEFGTDGPWPGVPRVVLNQPLAATLATGAVNLATAGEYADLAARQVGKRYVLGQPQPYKGGNPSAFDCSGLVVWLNNETGALPMGDDTAAGLYNRTSAVKAGSEKVGDLVFLRNNPARSNGIGHVAVLTQKLSNGDWRIIEARGKASGVVKTTLSYWKTRKYFTGVRRLKGFALATVTPRPPAPVKQQPVILVAGSANTADDKLHAKYKRRLDVALQALTKDATLKIVVTGGVKPGHKKSEAEVAKAYLLSQGVAASRIVEENRSGSTNGNFVYGLPLAKAAGGTSVTVVSDRSHMRRCLAFAWAASTALKLGIGVGAVAWYDDTATQDATVQQAAEQARAVYSGVTPSVVTALDELWSVTSANPALLRTVKRGNTGLEVRVLQRRLHASETGTFDSKTESAVLVFQKANKLEVDGIVGPKTWAKLVSA